MTLDGCLSDICGDVSWSLLHFHLTEAGRFLAIMMLE
jgi:hypothetical protein